MVFKKSPKLGSAVYVLPNLLTTGNLFFGFFSIVKSVQGDFKWAASAVALAAVFDVLDGRVARLTGATSEFGVQYDSLCDLLSFGLAPAFLMYKFGLNEMGRPGWIVCFLYLACGALRLARFNVQSSIGKASGDFTGLPIPMAAITVATFVALVVELSTYERAQTWAVLWAICQWLANPQVVRVGMLIAAPILAIAMVSNFAYRSHKVLKITVLKPFQLLVALVALLGLVAYEPELFGFLFSFLYAVSGPFEWIVGWKKTIDEDEIFTPIADGESPMEPGDVELEGGVTEQENVRKLSENIELGNDMLRVAVIGATGAVGRQMLEELSFFGIEAELGLFASARSAGTKIPFARHQLIVEEFHPDKLRGYHYALMSAGSGFSREFAAAIAANGCVVIDNSSAWRMDPDVPLVVPEVNGTVLTNNSATIIANPNCSTIQMVVSLRPLADTFGLGSVNVATYQSVSGSGQAGIDELTKQMQEVAQGQKATPQKYERSIFNNLIPAIDVLNETGHCFEEEKMIRETRKIMGLPELKVFATTVRVPVSHCHSEAITVTLRKPASREQLWDCFQRCESIRLLTEDQYSDLAYPEEIKDRREVFVSRVRLPLGESASHTVQYWNVADNLKKGAATNAVQTLKLLIDR